MSGLSVTVATRRPDADSLELWGDADSIALSLDSPAWNQASALGVMGVIHTGAQQQANVSIRVAAQDVSVSGCACSHQRGAGEKRGWGWVQESKNPGDWTTRRA